MLAIKKYIENNYPENTIVDYQEGFGITFYNKYGNGYDNPCGFINNNNEIEIDLPLFITDNNEIENSIKELGLKIENIHNHYKFNHTLHYHLKGKTTIEILDFLKYFFD